MRAMSRNKRLSIMALLLKNQHPSVSFNKRNSLYTVIFAKGGYVKLDTDGRIFEIRIGNEEIISSEQTNAEAIELMHKKLVDRRLRNLDTQNKRTTNYYQEQRA